MPALLCRLNWCTICRITASTIRWNIAWGVLELHWSGALLTDMEVVGEWTKTMRWDGVVPNVYFLDREYERGMKLTAKELYFYSLRLERKPLIERWSLRRS